MCQVFMRCKTDRDQTVVASVTRGDSQFTVQVTYVSRNGHTQNEGSMLVSHLENSPRELTKARSPSHIQWPLREILNT